MLQRILTSVLALSLAVVLVLLPDADRLRDLAPASWSFGHGPTVVMVHGLGSRVDHWLPTARLLAKNHRVVLVELPGHGLSSMPPPFTLEKATAALAVTLDDAVPESFVLVGHSIGGLVATEYALHHPGRVRALVLVETALRATFDPKERKQIRTALDTDWEGTLRGVWTSFGRDSAQGVQLYEAAAGVDPPTLRAWIDIALDSDLSNEVAGLRVPMRAVFAERNWEAGMKWPVAAVELGYERVPRITPERIEGSGHFVMLDRPALLARAIEAETAAAPAKPASNPRAIAAISPR